MSRQVLWDPKHTTYGAISSQEDENDPSLPEHGTQMQDFTHGEMEIKLPSRNGSLSKRDGSLNKRDNSYER